MTVKAAGSPVAGLSLLLAVMALAFGPPPLDYPRWWYGNTQPPNVEVVAPSGAQRETVQFPVRLQPADRSAIVAAYVDGQPVQPELWAGAGEGMVIAIDTRSLTDGEHRLEVEAEDRSRQQNRSRAVADFVSDNTPPKVDWELHPTSLAQGRAGLLVVEADEPATLSAELDGQPLQLDGDDRRRWAVVAVDPDARTSLLLLRLAAADLAGNRAVVEGQLSISPTQFERDDVPLPAGLAALAEGLEREAEEEYLRGVYDVWTTPRLWQGAFTRPVTGPVVTDFGSVRTYNSTTAPRRHLGVDIAAPYGSPVVAPNRGRVVVIGDLPVRGHVVVLDHGDGIFTTYAHLSEVLVQPGETVDPGQVLGRVGSTGLSTGPHLHWELWVRGVPVDALSWVELGPYLEAVR